MDFTVYKITPMGGPGGKRIMNLNLLLSTNSQNRKLHIFFVAKTLNRIELPTVDPDWSCRQGSGLLLLTADVEKTAELASLKLGSKWFSSNCYDASDKLKKTPSPTLSEKFTVTGNLVPRYESRVRDMPSPTKHKVELDLLTKPYLHP